MIQAWTTYHETLPGGYTFEMVRIEGGLFEMGNPAPDADSPQRPVHTVSLAPYWLGTVPVTQACWLAVTGNNPARFPGLDRPVENINYEDIATRFLPALIAQTGRPYRLPTEAEWEYAARGGALSEHYLYAGSDKLAAAGWYDQNSGRETHPVRLLAPNELGLYDLSGNVWEICSDWYDDTTYYKICLRQGIVHNPTGPASGTHKVIRGGSWYQGIGFDLHVRFRTVPDTHSENGVYNCGFRLAYSE
ncbi:MAG: formylglycine-generating enzyme family protein [Bacteroidia bacterium]|nr:formylglycine-generating enzyme family protein [Bacteroidia bacterium]